jgi:hypothetical protein
MKMANPNPNMKGLKPFPKGKSGNPGGIPKERKQLLMEAADMAAKVQHRLLEATVAMMLEHPEKEKMLELVTPDLRQIMKELLDRAEGTAKQSVDHTSGGKPIQPTSVVVESVHVHVRSPD